MAASYSRRSLFGSLRGGGPQQRPPWSRSENQFTDACTQCGKCLEACPTGIIVNGHAGYPIIDFDRGHCTFCGKCREICPTECFDTRPDARPWTLKAHVGQSCIELDGVACRMCEGICDHAAIGFQPKIGGGSTPFIRQERCTGCGACVMSCQFRAFSVSAEENGARGAVV